MKIGKYAKAIVAAVAAAAGTMVAAAQDSVVTGQEWVTIIVAGLGALGVTWAVPNKTPQDGAP